MLIGIIIAVIVVILLIFLWGSYNGLVNARNLVKNAWAQIDVQLKRRYDLIPNLVETVKGYKNFERDTLEAVTKARTAAQTASTGNDMAARSAAEGELSRALSRLMVVVEKYPDLKANQNFLALQEELTSTENKSVSPARLTTTRYCNITTRLSNSLDDCRRHVQLQERAGIPAGNPGRCRKTGAQGQFLKLFIAFLKIIPGPSP